MDQPMSGEDTSDSKLPLDIQIQNAFYEAEGPPLLSSPLLCVVCGVVCGEN